MKNRISYLMVVLMVMLFTALTAQTQSGVLGQKSASAQEIGQNTPKDIPLVRNPNLPKPVKNTLNRDDESFTVGLNSLNAQNFPFVFSNVAVNFPLDDPPVLDQSHFTVYENGTQQTQFFEVIPPETGSGQRLADIVFVLDVSGSMGGAIGNVKANMLNFINSLASSDINYRIGFITYADIFYVYNNYNLYSDVTEIQTLVNNIQLGEHGIGSGGDTPENQLGSMAEAALFNFRPGAQKVVIMLTDTYSHAADWATPWTVDTLISDRLLPNNITVFPIFDTYDYYSQNQYIPIAQATNTNGTYFHLYDNFNAIITEIGNLVANSYVVRYRSSNPNYDGVLRNVEYQVTYMGEQASAFGSYQPGAAPQIVRTQETLNLHNQTWPEETSFLISALITDLVEPFTTSARVYYRRSGTTGYAFVNMVNVDRSNLWQANLPAGVALNPGVDYYITATDGQSTSSSPAVDPSTNPYQLAVMPNYAPQITHTPVLQADAFSTVNITALVTDTTEYLANVSLYYRYYGYLSYTRVDMVPNDLGVYSAVIPGTIVANNGADYYIRATDNYGVSAYSGFADSPHHIAVNINGTLIPGGDLETTTWNLAGSPYYITGNITIPAGHTLIVENGVEVYIGDTLGLTVNGGLHATGATFTNSNPYIGWRGITFQDALQAYFNNCSFQHAVKPLVANNTMLHLIGVLITKTQNYTGEVAISIINSASAIIQGLQIENYATGISIQNSLAGLNSIANFNNINLQNGTGGQRPTSTGLELSGAVVLSLDGAEIEEYDLGLLYNASGIDWTRTTPALSNVRIRNTTGGLRTEITGMQLSGLEQIDLTNIEIEKYTTGLKMEYADSLRAISSPTITNVRIRNTTGGLRTETYGMLLEGAIAAVMDTVEVDGYNYGLVYSGTEAAGEDEPSPLRTTPALSNVRIRNTTGGLRTPVTGIKLSNLPEVVMNRNIVYVADQNRDAILGNGIEISGVTNASINHSTIWGYTTGLNVSESIVGLANSIIWADTDGGLIDPILGAVNITNSDVSYVGALFPGATYNIDPLFRNPSEGDFVLKYRSPFRDIAIGAINYSFDLLLVPRSYTMHQGWNLMGVPYLLPSWQNTPTSVFGDDLNPFYVSQFDTSIYQLNRINQNTSIEPFGIYDITYTGTYNIPSTLKPTMGYWVRNPHLTAVVDLIGVPDDGDYIVNIPPASNNSTRWYMLANPFEVPISWNNGMMVNGQVFPGAYIYDYDMLNYQLVFLGSDYIIPAWAGFFIQCGPAGGQVMFTYPTDAPEPSAAPVRYTNDNAVEQNDSFAWSFSLNAKHETAAAKVVVATHADASADYDVYDIVSLPDAPFVMPTPLKLSIPNNHWESYPGNYIRDTKPLDNGTWQWNLSLDLRNWDMQNNAQGEIVFSTDDFRAFPAEYQIRLTNLLTGESVDPRSENLSIKLSDLFIYNPVTGERTTGSDYLSQIDLRLEVNGFTSPVTQSRAAIITSVNYPNPFNPETVISYNLGQDNPVTLEIYNLKGQKVTTLVNITQSAGLHSVVWNGKDSKGSPVASGIYLYRLQAGKQQITRKILLSK